MKTKATKQTEASSHQNNRQAPEKVNLKSEFVSSTVTLRKLQSSGLIPKQITPTNLNTNLIYYAKSSPHVKYLLATQSNIIYYGEINRLGVPDSAYAVCIFPDGSYYEGKFKEGRQEGEGKLTNLQSSYSYTGSWKNGLPHGTGKEIIGQNIYEGQFKNGKKDGQGKLVYSDGSFYEGEFKCNVIEGEGKYYNKNNFWSGLWTNGYLQGPGKQIIAKNDLKDLRNAGEYVGDFYKGQRSGYGCFKWGKKYEYDGRFKKGQLDGEGTFKFKGRVYTGMWANGTEVKITEQGIGKNSVTLSKSRIDIMPMVREADEGLSSEGPNSPNKFRRHISDQDEADEV